jgi:hypothetical protein
MADIFVSYTSSDRDWAFWIAKELKALAIRRMSTMRADIHQAGDETDQKATALRKGRM